MKEQVKEQIRFMCKINRVECNEEFVEFVYNKHLDGFSGEILKNVKKEYEKRDKK